MLHLIQRKKIISSLGKIFKEITNENLKLPFVNDFYNAITLSVQENAWFTKESILIACRVWSESLTETNIETWQNRYPLNEVSSKKNVAIIMAGSIPLVGLHDLICVILCGHCALIKLSSKDKILIPFLTKLLIKSFPNLENDIQYINDKLTEYNAVIATGSNNSAKYFNYYFNNIPKLIRKNRNSIAILNGGESKKNLQLLGLDIFSYYGLGCRNVSKIFVPSSYNFKLFFESIITFGDVINHNKYANNYTYHKAIYLMNQTQFLDNNFLILKEDNSLNSPLSVLFYEFYNNINDVNKIINQKKSEIQVVLKSPSDFGKSQKPMLWDYADNIDVIDFLRKI